MREVKRDFPWFSITEYEKEAAYLRRRHNMHPITYRILHLNSAVFPCHCIEQEELLRSNRLSISVS